MRAMCCGGVKTKLQGLYRRAVEVAVDSIDFVRVALTVVHFPETRTLAADEADPEGLPATATSDYAYDPSFLLPFSVKVPSGVHDTWPCTFPDCFTISLIQLKHNHKSYKPRVIANYAIPMSSALSLSLSSFSFQRALQ